MSGFTCKYCGATSAIYTQVMPHVGEYCASCLRWIRWVPKKEHLKKEDADTNTSTITNKITSAQSIKDEARNYYEESQEEDLPWD